MKKLLAFILLFFPCFLMAAEYESPMMIYKPNYFIAGDKDDQVKFQVSAKYNLIYPSNIGLWVAYTQKAFWRLYDDSAPFWEFNHEPELFYMFESKKNIFNIDTGVLDHIQLAPIYHKSNGRDGLDSRGMNLYYGEIQLSVGKIYNFGVVAKAFKYYSVSKKNEDIDQYIGNAEGEVFFQLKSKNTEFFDKEKIYIRGGGNHESGKGWLEGGVKDRLITTLFQPFFYVQVFHGYGEAMVNYDKKDTAIRVGLVFE
jgi:outer membrane phospholipase A